MWNSCFYAFTNGFFSTVDSIPRKIDHKRELYAMLIDSRAFIFEFILVVMLIFYYSILFFFFFTIFNIYIIVQKKEHHWPMIER